eukprot:56117_1
MKQVILTKAAKQRIDKEIDDIKQNTLFNITAAPINSKNVIWKATIIGTPETPYENGHYDLQIIFPSNYPYRAPQLTFLTKIFHPNIDKHGNISCDILKTEWSPAYTLMSLLVSIQTCMSTGGNPQPPFSSQASKLIRYDVLSFVKKAAEMNFKYASGVPVPIDINSSTFKNFIPWVLFCQNKTKYFQKYEKELRTEKRIIKINKYHKLRFAKNINGPKGIKPDMTLPIDFKFCDSIKTLQIVCSRKDYIITIKKILYKKYKYPVQYQKLYMNDHEKELKNHYTISGLNVTKLTLNLTNCYKMQMDLLAKSYKFDIATNASILYPNNIAKATYWCIKESFKSMETSLKVPDFICYDCTSNFCNCLECSLKYVKNFINANDYSSLKWNGILYFTITLQHPQIIKYFMRDKVLFEQLLHSLFMISSNMSQILYLKLKILFVVKLLSRDIHIEWLRNNHFVSAKICRISQTDQSDVNHVACFRSNPLIRMLYVYFCSYYYLKWHYSKMGWTMGVKCAQYKCIGSKDEYKLIVKYTKLNESYCYLDMKDKNMKCNGCRKKYFDYVYNLKFDDLKFKWNKKYKLSKQNKWYKCAKCQMVYYCSRKCQKYDWNKKNHKHICSFFSH